jgi:GNAT superfamily N-acetyltransferase
MDKEDLRKELMTATDDQTKTEFDFHPVTPDRLPDLARFSEEHGKFRYCSCMRWRIRSSQFRSATKDQRVAALEALVQQGIPVGILASARGLPIGWCSVAPRETYAALERYRALPRLDGQPVWSVVCFFVDARYRRLGLASGLLRAAVDYAQSQGARIVKGYPVEPGSPSYTYMGSPGTFERAGFQDVTPAGQARRVARYTITRGEQDSE